MNLHEYQGKELFAKYDLPVSIGRVISNAEDAVNACRDIGGNKSVSYTHLTLPTILLV